MSTANAEAVPTSVQPASLMRNERDAEQRNRSGDEHAHRGHDRHRDHHPGAPLAFGLRSMPDVNGGATEGQCRGGAEGRHGAQDAVVQHLTQAHLRGCNRGLARFPGTASAPASRRALGEIRIRIARDSDRGPTSSIRADSAAVGSMVREQRSLSLPVRDTATSGAGRPLRKLRTVRSSA